MTNIREEFCTWYEQTYGIQPWLKGADMKTNDYMELAYQAAHEAQQVRIDELSEQIKNLDNYYIYWCKSNIKIQENITQITALEARCKELEDALSKINMICFVNKQDVKDISQIYMKSKQALSTKSLTEKEVK